MASPDDQDPLAARFRQADLRRLHERMVARLRRGRPLTGRIRLNGPSESERRAVAALLGGSAGRGRSLSIDLDVLSDLVTRGGRFSSLRQLVEAVEGAPVEDRRAQAAAERRAWSALWAKVQERPGLGERLGQWFAEPGTRQAIRRQSASDPLVARQLLDELFAVLERLPVQPPAPLARLAADVFGDSHALDVTTDRGRLAARAAAALAVAAVPRTRRQLRDAWSRVGVVLDELSTTVLVLNLPARPGTLLGDVLAMCGERGEPCRITFRQLRTAADCRFDPARHRAVYVCENPSILAAAADRLGAASRPLVCVEGQPNLAAEQLLRTLDATGFALHYHGDFDWGGLRIAARLSRLVPLVPWRYSTADYEAAPPGRRLTGQPIDAPWDERLRTALETRGTVVHEEAVLDELLEDLAWPGRPGHVATPPCEEVE